MKDLKVIIGELVAEASRKGICGEWKEMMREATSLDALVQLYVRGIDFCVNRHFPSLEYMEAHFKGVCERYGVYVNERAEVKNARRGVFVGRTTGTAVYDGYEVAVLYVKDEAEMEVVADEHSIVTMDCFDRSKVTVKAKNGAKVTVNLYGSAVVEYACDGSSEVKVVRKFKDTYEL